jgi:hypothetical protein
MHQGFLHFECMSLSVKQLMHYCMKWVPDFQVTNDLCFVLALVSSLCLLQQCIVVSTL